VLTTHTQKKQRTKTEFKKKEKLLNIKREKL